MSGLTLRGYLEESRELFTGMILVLPLFIMYQIGVLLTGGVRNGVDFVSDLLWALANGSLLNYLGINVAILIGFIAAIFVLRKNGEFKPKLWFPIVAESTVYALLLGSVVLGMMSSLGLDALLSTGPKDYGIFTSFVLSIGAGLYEEIVFRLILMGGMFWALDKTPGVPTFAAAAVAVIASSLIFSGIHYVGALGDPFSLGSFTFRFFAGIILAVIFYVRGFAVAVYTHAIYDIIVMVFN